MWIYERSVLLWWTYVGLLPHYTRLSIYVRSLHSAHFNTIKTHLIAISESARSTLMRVNLCTQCFAVMDLRPFIKIYILIGVKGVKWEWHKGVPYLVLFSHKWYYIQFTDNFAISPLHNQKLTESEPMPDLVKIVRSEQHLSPIALNSSEVVSINLLSSTSNETGIYLFMCMLVIDNDIICICARLCILLFFSKSTLLTTLSEKKWRVTLSHDSRVLYPF